MTYHCMHEMQGGRYCCWCSLRQQRVRDLAAVHGPNFPGQRFDVHLEPPSTGECPRDAVKVTNTA